MSDAPESVVRLPFPAEACPSRLRPSDLERQVVELFDAFRERLLRYVLSFGIPSHEGEELIQEVFLLLFRHLQLGRSRSNLRGWIFRVAHNLALKKRMSNQRLQNMMRSDDAIANQQIDSAPSPEEQLARSEKQRRLWAVLRALPEQDRRCLYLRAEGLRYREIAGVLSMSLGAVSISITRSLARLGRANEG